MSRVALTLFGGFQSRLDSGPAVTLGRRKAEALLAYLAMPPGREHPKKKLAAFLWADDNTSAARIGLRQVLFAIRNTLRVTPPIVISDGATVALDPSRVEVDVLAFEREARGETSESWQRAVDLYRGDLLVGLSVQDVPFEDWLIAERERLRDLAETCLMKLLDHHSRNGDVERAIQAGLRLIGMNPLQERVCRSLMELYASSGRRGSALRQYQLCVSTLQRELGVEPEAETKALYQEILRSPVRREAPVESTLTPPLASDTALIGRDRELGALLEALTHATARRGRVVTVLGEAGIGKTRLMAELASEASRQGFKVLIGRAYETEQALPFGPWVDTLRSARLGNNADLLDHLDPVYRTFLACVLPEVQIGPELINVRSDDRRTFESVAELIRLQAETQPVLVILEDLHWADQMTVRLSAFLGHRLQSWRVVLVLTAREDELAELPHVIGALDDLGRESHAGRHVLSPLTKANTELLVRTLSRGSGAAKLRNLAEDVWSLSEGNPFVVTEALRDVDWQPAATTLTVPQRVRGMIERRLDRLTNTSQHVVATAAVIGRDFDFALLHRASGLTLTEAAESVEELVRRRVIQGVGERLDFVHQRIQDTVLVRLLPHQRAIHHHAVADAVESLYADALETHDVALATHYRRAGAWDRAMMYSGRAAFRALSDGANHEAAALLQQALDALDHLPQTDDVMRLKADLLLALAWTGYNRAEIRIMTEALYSLEPIVTKLKDHGRLQDCFQGLAAAFMILGDLPAATRAVERAVAHSGPTAEVIFDFRREVETSLHHFRGDYRRATAAARAEIDALGGGQSYARHWGVMPSLSARSLLALDLTVLGEFAGALRVVDELLEVADKTGHTGDAMFACQSAGWAYLVKGDLPKAIPTLERMLSMCDQGGNYFRYFSRAARMLGLAYALSGRVGDGLELIQRALATEHALGFSYHETRSLVGLGQVYLLSGDIEAAAQSAAQALKVARDRGFRGLDAEILHLHGEIARARHDAHLAAGFYQKARTLATRLGMRPLIAHCHRGLAETADSPRARGIHRRAAEALYREMQMYFSLDEAAPKMR